MANSSKRSCLSSAADASSIFVSTNQPVKKSARYSAIQRSKHNKKKLLQPFVSVENENVKPALRCRLELDARFFPVGVQPGNIIEIKGPEKSGKTFLLTYFIARMLTTYPEKKVAFIDTRHKFNVRNLLSILSHTVSHLAGMRSTLNNKSVPDIIREFPQLSTYMDRISVIKCYSAEDLILTVGPPGESTLQKLLLHDAQISLVAIDCVDNFSYAESLKELKTDQLSNLMRDIQQSVSYTRCPVICTTLIPAGKHEYKRKYSAQPGILKRNPNNESNEPSSAAGSSPHAQQVIMNQPEETVESNIVIDFTAFTSVLEIVPAPEAQKEKIVLPNENKIHHYATAYLRSRHNANIAGLAANQGVKFLILSDMLWVDKV